VCRIRRGDRRIALRLASLYPFPVDPGTMTTAGNSRALAKHSPVPERDTPSSIGKRNGLNSSTVAELFAVIHTELSQISAEPISVLEAGGGSATFLGGFDRRFTFTTIDISQEQLDKNLYAAEKILHDLQTFDYGTRQFHVVVCWDVLEHLSAPRRAMLKLLDAIPIGGIIIVKGPIPDSLKGLVTRWTPHVIHILFYRWILGKTTAGMAGYAPFRSQLRPDASPDLLRKALESEGFVVVAQSCFTTNQIEKLKEKLPIGYYMFRILSKAMLFLSRGRYGGLASDFYLVARRTGNVA
jgi:Methyltransferase domain